MGAQFDWTLMQTAQIPLPWMLGGGLDSGNVARAIEQSGTPCVDVSSGVEKNRGEKNHSAISRFVQAAKFG
jgi:phosphoribosylanthranilate isomerase